MYTKIVIVYKIFVGRFCNNFKVFRMNRNIFQILKDTTFLNYLNKVFVFPQESGFS